jgi:hypothetical protein
VANFGRWADGFVGHMSDATDESAGAAAGVAVAVACGKTVVAGLALVDVDVDVDVDVVHMAAAAANGRMDETSETAYWIAHLIEHMRAISVKQDSCHSQIVAARIVRAAEGRVMEAVRQNTHFDVRQAV